MIVADASALAAILFGEPDADVFVDKLAREADILIGAPTLIELRLAVLHRKGPDFLPEVDRLIEAYAIRAVPWRPEYLAHATDAAIRFRGRPARLNFGDCLSYAVARAYDAALLFKGGDFALTDIRSALD